MQLSYAHILFCVSLLLSSGSTGLLKGTYDMILEGFQVVEENDAMMSAKKLKISKYNRSTTVLNGTLEFMQDITNSLLTDLVGYEQYGAKYQRSVMNFRNQRYCDYINNIVWAGTSMRKMTNLTSVVSRCPIPKGVYFVNNFVLPEESYLPVAPGESKWRIDFRLHQNGQLWSHTRIFFRFQSRRRLAAQ